MFHFVLFGRVGVFIFCCLGEGRFFFFAVWAGGLFFVLLFGRERMFFFCCLGGSRFVFCCLGGCVCFFFCCLGGGREFTHLPVCLARLQATQQQKRPNNQKKTRVPSTPYSLGVTIYPTPSTLRDSAISQKYGTQYGTPNSIVVMIGTAKRGVIWGETLNPKIHHIIHLILHYWGSVPKP